MNETNKNITEETQTFSESPIPEKYLPEAAKQWKWRTRNSTLINGIQVRIHETVSERKKSA